MRPPTPTTDLTPPLALASRANLTATDSDQLRGARSQRESKTRMMTLSGVGRARRRCRASACLAAPLPGHSWRSLSIEAARVSLCPSVSFVRPSVRVWCGRVRSCRCAPALGPAPGHVCAAGDLVTSGDPGAECGARGCSSAPPCPVSLSRPAVFPVRVHRAPSSCCYHMYGGGSRRVSRTCRGAGGPDRTARRRPRSD